MVREKGSRSSIFGDMEILGNILTLGNILDIGKYSFLNRTIQRWNNLPAEVFENPPCKHITFKRKVRKAIIKGN
jgi:hypothetical protein